MTPATRADIVALADRLQLLIDAVLAVHAPPGDGPVPAVVAADVDVIRGYRAALLAAVDDGSDAAALRAVNACSGINKGLGDDGLLDGDLGGRTRAIMRAVVPIARALRADLGMAF